MAATAVLQPYNEAQYDHRAFDSLMDVDESAYYFDSLTGYEHLRSGLRDIFMRHGVSDELAVALLHRHFEMSTNEKLVELGPVSSPWPIAAHEDSVLGGHILPHTWRVFENELHPLEFRFIPQQEFQDARKVQFSQAFFEDFRQYVKANGLENVVGITQLDHGRDADESDVQLMEVTHGRNSIMVPAVPSSDVSGPAFQTIWSFVEKQSSKLDADGIQTRHGLCYKASSTDAANDGIQTRHGLCYKATSTDASNDGIQTRHGLCYKASSTDAANDGIQTRHGLCYKADSTDATTDGIQTRHGLCYKANSNDGIQTNHGLCYKATSTNTTNDGIQTRHGLCYKANSNPTTA
ncbi:hypothetical protein BO78DRAFT_417586 [Aspergillus sclerotiicarbonarius CBS 121057]|uniref:Uncharacterized protein n=1 Tax=Aspergillus sclerotiicarbonarius (strain CBS 121057 / IBT 28362) TaxID=1448318 RepID=A0A319ECU3_ASPSB|nr:hypothetical protein BO78DRAFT_417586 [Aspergillus sclerotiicarbonarius CBS 121057]